ncbi:MAG TPA: glycosyltransferase family 2 protein [Candidatus Udaeobacter sp.]|nr:glycosyltransferase family 2 protein [Candidatus Udaeobacter sp.]
MTDEIQEICSSEALTKALPPGLSILVPVYNSSEILPDLVERIVSVAKSLDLPFEVILVNDGSSDDSWSTIRRLTGMYPGVRGISMMRNYGQHNSLLAALRLAEYATSATLDDDLQHPPEELPKLIQKLGQGFDVIYGSPETGTHGFLRNIASAATKITLRSAMGAESARHVSAFRVFKTHLRRAFRTFQSPFVSLDVLLTWGTANFGFVRVRHNERRIGRSTYSLWKLIRHALNMVTGFSVLPLQLASVIGFAFSLWGLVVLLYVLSRFMLYGSTVAGFPFLASIIAIFSGAQLFALGILGEYMARIHFRSLDRPTYTVAETTDNN